MKYLDFDRLEALDPAHYQATAPYPFANPVELLHPEAFEVLRANLPDLDLMTRSFDVERRGGQSPHDRYLLEYKDGLELSTAWREFLGELTGGRYKRALCRLVGIPSISFNFHWHYTPNGCSVSPHCDSTRKLGSHIFYFNTPDDWNEGWGGETVILDDRGRFKAHSAPAFEDFDRAISSPTLGNRSLIFTRNGNSWHGVRPIECPEGHLRKVFIVVLNRDGALDRMRNALFYRRFERF